MNAVEITDEAVEAAVVAFRDAHAEGVIVGRHEKAIRAVLEAALPHLAPRPVVDREALKAHLLRTEVVNTESGTWDTPTTQEADHIADAVLALFNGPKS